MNSVTRAGAGAGVALAACIVLLAGCTSPTPTPTASASAPTTATATATPTSIPTPTGTPTPTPTAFADLSIGMCLTDLAGSLQVESGTVTVVPCSEAHSSEVYSLPGLPGDAYPGDESVAASASDACTNDFTGYVGQSVSVSDLDPGVYVPDQAGWASGERRAVCVVFYPKGDVVGSLKGIGATPPQLGP